MKIVFTQISKKRSVGTDLGFIYNDQNQPSHLPQDSPEGAWLVSVIDVSDEELKGYKLDVGGGKWLLDNTFKITIIE